MIERFESFVDDRGEIRDLLREVKIDSVTLITRHPGAVGGNHYHAQTTQWLFLVEGALRVVTQAPGGPVVESFYYPGDFWVDPPLQIHAWEAIEETTVLVFTQGPRSGLGYESDTTRLPPEERLI